MPEIGEFKVTNPQAPFIKLVEFLEKSKVPHNKYGDVKWLLQNFEKLSVSSSDRNEVKNLLLELNFMKGK